MASHTYIRRQLAGHLLAAALKLTGDEGRLEELGDYLLAVRMRNVRNDLLQLRAAIEGRIAETRDPRGARQSDRDSDEHQ